MIKGEIMKCKNCGHAIKKNNRKIVRPPGEKPYSICRHCPGTKIEATAVVTKAPVPRPVAQRPAAPALVVSSPPRAGLGAVAVKQIITKRQAITLEGSFQGARETRFFIRPAMADKIRRAAAGKMGGPTVTIEVIPAPAEQVDAFPDQFQDLIEIQVTIKGEG